jgi:hypothetical protein
MIGFNTGSNRTLSLSGPTGAPILWALPFLLLFFGSLESAVRLPAVQDKLSFPRMGSRHSQVGAKYTRLQAFVRAVGHVDCIAIGSSTVDQAFDPVIFASAYQAETGEPIHCFNFAIDAIVPSASSKIAAILVEDFRPDLLIIGTDARDLTVAEDARDITVVTETPWVRYRSGQPDLRGWLMEHSYTYRYAYQMNLLVRGQYSEAVRQEESGSVALGQTPQDAIDLTVTQVDYAYKDEGLMAYYRERLGNFEILPENTDGLRRMLAINGAQTRIILVEMPVPPAYFRFFDNPAADYSAFLTHVEQLAAQTQAPFWKTTELGLIPDDGWVDFSHVNTTGANAFSTWLGHKVGALAHE